MKLNKSTKLVTCHQISRPRPHAADQKGLKGRSRGQNLAEISENFGKIDFARFGPNMAHLAIGTVTAGLAQFF